MATKRLCAHHFIAQIKPTYCFYNDGIRHRLRYCVFFHYSSRQEVESIDSRFLGEGPEEKDQFRKLWLCKCKPWMRLFFSYSGHFDYHSGLRSHRLMTGISIGSIWMTACSLVLSMNPCSRRCGKVIRRTYTPQGGDRIFMKSSN